MTAFFQNQSVSDAQAEGLKYAVQNPLTKAQIDTALRKILVDHSTNLSDT
jgi:hypothetical protein